VSIRRITPYNPPPPNTLLRLAKQSAPTLEPEATCKPPLQPTPPLAMEVNPLATKAGTNHQPGAAKYIAVGAAGDRVRQTVLYSGCLYSGSPYNGTGKASLPQA